ncbi:hypothetical protein MVEN_01294400 [Mycena venus]|uniref:Uncharacterized protein n=1 Tax=Mycena venus TaxID=2733690 RepID=A0A8H6Y0H8_9AGAR|nr:hypothetical protein MVEN_01294400 [Mycena venus]
MASSYSPVPYPSLPASNNLFTMFLLVPMPVPRTPNAPYFDERGVRAFLDLILLHGSNAGITNADTLVTFIVRYSSDRVREVIRYIPELDDDTPNRTWMAACEQMLLLYGSLDDDRHVSEWELVEFCREQSAKSPFRTKLEIEHYLRNFQFIAAPLLKQKDITIPQRDFYFVSGIPSAIKNWFIMRVPESQRTRSNPIPLTDSLGILYEHFDPDSLFPDLWNELNSFELAATISLSNAPPTLTPASTCSLAITAPLPQRIQSPTPIALAAFVPHTAPDPVLKPEFPKAPVSVPTPSATAPFVLDTPNSPQVQEIYPNPDQDDISCDDLDADEEFKVSPSEHNGKSAGKHVRFSSTVESRTIERRSEESTVYFCGRNKVTDRISELRDILIDIEALQVSTRQQAELSNSHESTLSTDKTLRNWAEIYRHIEDELNRSIASNGFEDLTWASDDSDVLISTEGNEELERYLAGKIQDPGSELSSLELPCDGHSATITDSDLESMFDFDTGQEADGATQQLNCQDVLEPERITLSFTPYGAHSDPRSKLDAEPTDPQTTSAEIDDDYERYLAGGYDGSGGDSVFDFVTDLQANSPQSSCTELDDTNQSFEVDTDSRKYSFSSNAQVLDLAELSCHTPSVTVSDSRPRALSLSLSYDDSEAAFDPVRSSFEHSSVQQRNDPEFDLAAVLDLYTLVEPSQLSIPSPITCVDPDSEPDSVTDLFLELFYNEKNPYNLSAPFPRSESEKNSSEPSAVFINYEQDAKVDFELYIIQDIAELSYIPPSTHLLIEPFITEQKFPEPRHASSDNEHDLELIYDLYSAADINELSHHSTSIHFTPDSEPTSVTDMFIELILSQEISQGVDFEAVTSANEHDPSTSAHSNPDEDLCPILKFYTEQIEYPSRTEPFKGAESQPFSLRKSYVHDFVPESLVSRTESHMHARIKPTDDSPGYQESVLTSEPSFCIRASSNQS